MKKAVVCDIDGVVIRGESQLFFLMYLFFRRKMSLLRFLKIFMWFFVYRFGWRMGMDAIRREAYGVFKGWTIKEFGDTCNDFFKEDLKKRINGLMVKKLKCFVEDEYEIVFASATLACLAENIASFVGFGHVLATRLECVGSCYTGSISGDAIYGDNKCKAVVSYFYDNGIGWAESWMFTDDDSDMTLLELVQNPVVVSPRPKLERYAKQRGWQIIYV